jgi:hypothetical protein
MRRGIYPVYGARRASRGDVAVTVEDGFEPVTFGSPQRAVRLLWKQ